VGQKADLIRILIDVEDVLQSTFQVDGFTVDPRIVVRPTGLSEIAVIVTFTTVYFESKERGKCGKEVKGSLRQQNIVAED
jgi:hypothetical protein